MGRVVFGTAAAVLFAVGLAAQTPASQGQPATQDEKEQKTLTVTGCLRTGEQPDTFVLENAKLEQKKDTTAGTTGAAESPAKLEGATLRLVDAPADVKLREHVGHTVQITGMIASADRAKTAPAPAGTTADPTRPGAEKAGPSLNVRTMRHVAATCTQ